MASRERKKIYMTKKNVFEEKRIYLHGCFDSFGMLRFASRVKESSSSRCVAQMNALLQRRKKKKPHFLQGNVFRVYITLNDEQKKLVSKTSGNAPQKNALRGLSCRRRHGRRIRAAPPATNDDDDKSSIITIIYSKNDDDASKRRP